MKSFDLPLRVVFYYESDRWIAHCLEFDLLGDGKRKEDALDCLSESIRLQIINTLEHDNPENLFTPAEGKYFHMFARGKHIAVGKLQINFEGFELDDVNARVYEPDYSTDSELVTA